MTDIVFQVSSSLTLTHTPLLQWLDLNDGETEKVRLSCIVFVPEENKKQIDSQNVSITEKEEIVFINVSTK